MEPRGRNRSKITRSFSPGTNITKRNTFETNMNQLKVT